MKIHPLGGELFHVGGRISNQTDKRKNVTKEIIALRNYANSSKNKDASTVRVTIFYCHFCEQYNWCSLNRPISHTSKINMNSYFAVLLLLTVAGHLHTLKNSCVLVLESFSKV
jgi:hypothetical protein